MEIEVKNKIMGVDKKIKIMGIKGERYYYYLKWEKIICVVNNVMWFLWK